MVVRVSVSDIKSWKPRTLRLTHAWAGQAVDLLREIRGQPVPGDARAALLEIMAGVPELSGEAALLAAVPSDAPLRVPDGSLTRTSAWTVYDAAIRTAAYFLQHQRPDSPLTEREVAAHALPDSKEWTPRLSSWSVSRLETDSPLWSTISGSVGGSAGASGRLPPTPCGGIPG